MANRDAKLIKRIIQDFSLNAGEGGNGEPIEVTTLPEVGDPNAVYKTSDNKYWICTNTTETTVVSDLKVGNSYTLKEEVINSELAECVNKILDAKREDNGNIYFEETENTGIFYEYIYAEEAGQTDYWHLEYYTLIEEDEWGAASFGGNSGLDPEEELEVNLDLFETVPTVKITQYFVDQLSEFQYGTVDLSDFAFLFKNGSHEEEVVVSTWTELVPSEPSINTTLTIQYGSGRGTLTVSLDGENLEIEELVENRIYIIKNVPEGSLLNCTYIIQNDEVSVLFNEEHIVGATESPVSFNIITTGKDYLHINDYTNK